MAYRFLLVLLLLPLSAPARDLPQPQGPVLLTVTGIIEHTNAPGQARFDRQMLEALGLAQVHTTTTWTEGRILFEGVLLARILEFVGAQGDTIVARALNDYMAEIPASDLEHYPVLVAMTMDGEPMTPRDKGPLWIIYPRDDYPQLNTPYVDQRWVWQLNRLKIK
ncbi:MAG: molybdopterin-dependent oxidoreductase [Candidatus Competibacteraceae bacterium]|nr:molybdopterin-dependent oxidoreductase [Candidatus Competibacteraceae bacterium]